MINYWYSLCRLKHRFSSNLLRCCRYELTKWCHKDSFDSLENPGNQLINFLLDKTENALVQVPHLTPTSSWGAPPHPYKFPTAPPTSSPPHPTLLLGENPPLGGDKICFVKLIPFTSGLLEVISMLGWKAQPVGLRESAFLRKMLLNNYFPINFSILLDVQSLLSMVTTLLAFSHFANKNYSVVLTTLQERNEEKDVCFSDLYLKGENL